MRNLPRSSRQAGPARWAPLVLLLVIPVACSDPTSPYPAPVEVGTWQPLGQGLTGSAWTFLEWDGDLLVGGAFRTAGDQPARNIARWDGELWHTLGTGLDGPVQDLVVFQGEVVAGGFFGPDRSRAFRWDGGRWLPLGMLQDGGILSLGVHDGVLYAQGSEVSRWTGSTWERVEVEVGGESMAAEPPMAVHDGDFVVGAAGSESFARWDGAVWTWMERPPGLLRLVAGDGELYGLGGSNHFRWTGSGWAELPATASWWSWTVHEGDLVLGVQGPDSHHVSRWSGSAWVPLPGAMDARSYGLASWEGTLLAGGDFVAIDQSPIRGVARILPPEPSAQGGSS